ncbi:MAG: HDOD domain-containing protein [Deltaproteobacteria bacterium]|nr:HDOD domain-containing protein [Deltaproteobacteria bacterium]
MAAPKESDPFLGKLIADRFQVLEKIGEGGMGRVYRAEQTSIQRQIALKVLTPSLSDQENLQERFRNEASLASRLSHPNTVIIYDFGIIEEGSMFIAMELIEGSSLDDNIKTHGAMEWKRACRVGTQICSSLQNAHDNAIIHRDLKPENIMITNSGAETDMIKVLDFGIAKILSDDTRGIKNGLTAPNEIFGTPDYMSPEQARGDVLDSRTDIYSLGIILFRMLTGVLPFTANTPIETLAKHLAEAPRSFSAANPKISIPQELEKLVMSTLAKQIDERPESMRAIVEQLKHMMEGATVRLAVEKPDRSQPKPQKRDLKPAYPKSEKKHRSAPAPKPAAEQSEQVEKPAEERHDDMPASAAAPVAAQVAAPVAEAESNDDIELTPLEKLVARMKKKRDFPAVSQHISELNTKVGLVTTSAPQLANVILKDTALTTKLIKLVNSPFYGQVRGKITTVSRAVVMMGFEAVRDAALSLLLFDHLEGDSPKQAAELRDAALGSLMSGIVARSMSEQMNGTNKEEAFVCAMFHNLGRHVAIYYFPDEMEEVGRLMETKGITERSAVHRALGVSFEDLGKELGKNWEFPEKIRDTMDPLAKGDLDKPRSNTDKLHHLAGFSNELTEIAATLNPAKRSAKFKALSKRFGSSIKISEEQIDEILETAAEQLEEYAKMMNVNIKESPLIAKVLNAAGRDVPLPQGVQPVMERATESGRIIFESRMPQPVLESTAEQIAAQELIEKKQILIDGAAEIAAIVKGRYDLNSLMLMVLETMYRGLGFSRVIFCLNDVKKHMMRGRSGFGDGVDDIIGKFQFSSRGSANLFSQAVTQGRDLVVHDSKDRRFASKIPRWYRDVVNAPMFMLYPITIKRFPAAMFYGDMTQANIQIDRVLVEQMEKLRNHAAQAITKSHQTRRS